MILKNIKKICPLYFGICHMSHTVTLLITSIIHRKFDRAYINPITLTDTANRSIYNYPLGIRSSWLLKSFPVFQPFFPRVPLLTMQFSNASLVCTFCVEKKIKKNLCFVFMYNLKPGLKIFKLIVTLIYSSVKKKGKGNPKCKTKQMLEEAPLAASSICIF